MKPTAPAGLRPHDDCDGVAVLSARVQAQRSASRPRLGANMPVTRAHLSEFEPYVSLVTNPRGNYATKELRLGFWDKRESARLTVYGAYLKDVSAGRR
jgi:hypothetical protein